MSEWKECKLADVAERFAMGPFGSNIKAENFTNAGVPVIRGTNLNYYKYVDGAFVFLTEEKADQLRSSNCFPGDLVFTHRGTIGQVGLIPSGKYPRYVVSQSGMKVTVNPKLIDNNFLFYFFKSDRGQYELLQNESQVGVPSISSPLTSLKAVTLNLPPLSEQRAIASVLTSLDDKIDLLNRQNKTLEAMAETLFRQWFVEEAEVSSEKQILLGDLIETVSITHSFPGQQIIFLNTSDIYLGDVINHRFESVKDLPGQAKKSIEKGDILFSEIRPANGRYAYIDFEANDYVVSTKLMVLRSKGVLSQSFVYFYLTNHKTLEWLQTLAEARSGTFPQITFDQLQDLAINVPSDELLRSSSQLCDGWLRKIRFNHAQIRVLEKIRNALLTKLMSGEVRVEK